MKLFSFSFGFAVCLAVAAVAARAAVQAPSEPVTVEIQARLASGACGGERLLRLVDLRRFYQTRERRPAWSEAGNLSPQTDVLLSALRTADREGLPPAAYHLDAIEALFDRIRHGSDGAAAGDADAADLDLLLSDAFFLYASHLTAGRVQPVSLEPEWNIAGRGRDLVFLLTAALERGHLAATIDALPPVREDYRLLRTALAAQRAIAAAGGWPPVPGGPTLREGDRGPRVQLLRRRLAAGGELPSGAEPDGDLFDAPLADVVARFQSRHGLEADRVVGRRTLAALNTPASGRVRQIEVNLERLRWLPRDLGESHLLVNVAAFRLELFERGAPTLEMRVIAGRLARRTPFFTGEITSVMFNPDWTVPEKLVIEDKLPLILEDPDYLAEQGFKVFAPVGRQWREVDPAEIDWAHLPKARFPYRLRQDPGPANALGRVKFESPNRHDIYLHDTPSHELFAHSERAFSSGCVRVERARDLAERLLAADPAWTRARIEATIAAGDPVRAQLPTPLPFYLLYRTAWVDREGALQLREDVYGRDRALIERLSPPLRSSHRPPSSRP